MMKMILKKQVCKQPKPQKSQIHAKKKERKEASPPMYLQLHVFTLPLILPTLWLSHNSHKEIYLFFLTNKSNHSSFDMHTDTLAHTYIYILLNIYEYIYIYI